MKKETNKTIYVIIEICLIILSIFLFICGRINGKFNVGLCGVLVALCANILFCFQDFKSNFLFFFLQITLFTFQISRPFIGMCKRGEWWNESSQQSDNIWFALLLLLVTETALYIGANIMKSLEEKWKNKVVKNMNMLKELQTVSLLLFSLTIAFYLIEQFEPLFFFCFGNYLDYYTSFSSKLPGVFHTMASFAKYSLCIFLATLPNKKSTFVPLALNVFSTIPSLLIGMRNPTVLSLLFALSYYLLRDYMIDEKKWIGKIEKILLTIATPLLIIFMGLYAYVRSGEKAMREGFFSLIADFFYGQGVTFNVTTISYGYRLGIKQNPHINYTFGGFIDYIYRGSIGQKVFHTEALTSYNSEFNAHNSNSLSHILSYLSMKEEYLEGHGRGSSYLIETWMDFGYIGVFIFSIIIGMILIYMVYGFGKRVLLSTIILVGLQNIFFIPRAEATGWLTFLIYVQFWFCIGVCYFGAYILKRVKSSVSIQKN